MKENKPTLESLSRALASICEETWRFRKVFERLLVHVSPTERIPYIKQQKWFEQKLKDALMESGLAHDDLGGWDLQAAEDGPYEYDFYGFFLADKGTQTTDMSTCILCPLLDPLNNKH